jgi:hypothetical protein
LGAEQHQQQNLRLQLQQLHQSALLFLISDHTLAVTHLSISPAGMLLTASKDGTVRMYRLEQPLGIGVDDSASGAATSSASAIGGAHRLPSPPALFTHSFRAPVAWAALDPSESYVFAAVKENLHWIPLYATVAPAAAPSAVDLATARTKESTGTPVYTWSGHTSSVIKFALSPSGSHLMSLDAEGHLKLWSCCPPGSGLPRVASISGVHPPIQGICIKNVGRRTGCKNISLVESREMHPKGNLTATINTYIASQQTGNSGKLYSAPGGVKEGSWVFPPLNAHTPSPFVYVAVPLVHTAVQNQEFRRLGDAARSRKSSPALCGWGNAAIAASPLAASTTSPYLRADWELVCGLSGWSALAESVANRGTTLERLQSELEHAETNMNEMYQLCVQKIIKSERSALAVEGAKGQAAEGRAAPDNK